MSTEPLDTRVINGRFVGPDAPADAALTIHDGVVVDDPNHDVWRTVNASGHLVFPGLMQPSPADIESALTAVRAGMTTATSDSATANPCVDVLPETPESIEVIEPNAVGELTEEQWDKLLSDAPVHFQAPAGSNFPVVHFLYHEGHVRREMSLERLVAVTSGNIARASGTFPSKGSFATGADGDLLVFDPEGDDPYGDRPWPGRVIFSLLRGAILLYNGQIHTSPGDGKRLG